MFAFDPGELRTAVRACEIASEYYLDNPRVRLIDVGWKIKEGEYTGKLAVRVHLRSKPSGAAFEAFAQRYGDQVIETERIPFPEVDFIQAAYSLQWYGYFGPSSERAEVFRPLRGGISVSNRWYNNYGTLGGVVKDRETDEEMLLSNWHVFAGSPQAPKGLEIYQPGRGDGGWSQHTVARLERDGMDEYIDAAVAKLTAGETWINEQFGVGAVSGVAAPALDMHVIKSGRGSDVTEGIVDGIAGEFSIYYEGELHKIKHVYRIVPLAGGQQVSTGGDSGSWWLEKETHKAVALHFAGYDSPETALAMAMPPVLDALKVYIPDGA